MIGATGLDRIPTWSGNELNVIIETPKGRRNKLAYEPKLGVFAIRSILPTGQVFPFDFGFLPSTEGEDSDPLDILVLLDEPCYPGTLVRTRLVGVIEIEQTEADGKKEKNDRLVGVPSVSHLYTDVHRLDDLTETARRDIEHFFTTYSRLQGKQVQVLGRGGPDRARQLVEDGRRKRAAK